jgi:hypothetical protein
LGAVVNATAVRRKVRLLKEMGSNAYRTSHNMPEPELVEACNEMGMMIMAESFDEWKRAKMKNGYHRHFQEWVERDITNLVRRYRNDPSVVMWCIGNEVPDQGTADGGKLCRTIQDIFHREDPTRPCTIGMDRVDLVLHNGFAHIPVTLQLSSQVDDITTRSRAKVVPMVVFHPEGCGVCSSRPQGRHTSATRFHPDAMPGEIFGACQPVFNFLYDGNHILSHHKEGVSCGTHTFCSSNNRYICRVPG